MAIVIKEIHVRTTVERANRTPDVSEGLVRKIKQNILDELRYSQQKNGTTNRKGR
ncbi:MAG: hypothetical protein LBR97_05770 [Dysgonamonadaceae bacterium]|jgi:hypothetical protein|nr:hypothetical protein [Dysgonamonadaceae bacterium]